MKKLLLMLFLPLLTFAAKGDIFGKWITEKADNGNQIIVEFYEKNSKIYGRIDKLTNRFDDKGELKKDAYNPDASKKNRTLEGIDFVSNFSYNESNDTYENGKIYDPSTGKTYECYIKLESDGRLKVRGHLPGLTFIGKTQYWKKYSK